MNIEVKKTVNIEPGDFETIEGFVGGRLNNLARGFFEKFNGGEVSLNTFNVGNSNNSGVSKFIPLMEVISELKRFEFKKGFIPIAWAEGGNYVAIELISGGVYFVDHELYDSYVELAENIDIFLDNLSTSSNNDVVLQPSQVIKVWTNPNPRKCLKDS